MIESFECIGSDDKRTLKRQQKRRKTTKRLRSQSPDDCPSDGSISDSGEDRAEREVNVIDKCRPYECQYCDRRFKGYKALGNHINRCHPEHAIEKDNRRPRYTCGLNNCRLSFPTLTLMFDHQKSDHTIDKSFACSHPNCHYESSDPKDFYSHRMTHSLNRPFVCTVAGCGKQFFFKDRLTAHIGRVHREKTIPCSESCGKMFKTNKQMRVHVNSVHMAVKKYQCQWPGCEYSAHYKHATDGHFKSVHTKEKNIVCDLCGKRFLYLHELPKHKKTSHKMGPALTCSWPGCDYSTHDSTLMSNHTLDHQNGPRFACDWPECNKRVKTKQSLKDHINAVHKQLKTHLCPVMDCSYRTANRRCIRQHLKTHEKHSEKSIHSDSKREIPRAKAL